MMRGQRTVGWVVRFVGGSTPRPPRALLPAPRYSGPARPLHAPLPLGEVSIKQNERPVKRAARIPLIVLIVVVVVCTGLPAPAQVTMNLDALNALPQGIARGRHPAPRQERRAARITPRETARPARNMAAPAPTPPVQEATARPMTLPAPSASASAEPPIGTVPPAPSPPMRQATARPMTMPAPSASAAAPPAATLPPAPPPVPPAIVLAPAAPPGPASLAALPGAGAPATNAVSSHAASEKLQLAFASGQSDLSAANADAVKRLVTKTPDTGTAGFSVLGYASGSPNDPSTARRLSLSRALAVRSALISAGVPSTRITVRALGAGTDGAPADRAEISVTGAGGHAGASEEQAKQP